MRVEQLKIRKMFVDGKRIETLWIPPSRRRSPSERQEAWQSGEALPSENVTQPGKECTLVMLHGGLGSIGIWKDLPQWLAQNTGCGVLAYDRYGNGRSQPSGEKRPVSYMHHEGEVVLPELLAKLGVGNPILIGHSDGGSIAIVYAGKFCERVRGLILLAPHVFVEEISLQGALNAKAEYERSDLRQKLAKYHANVDATFWGWNDVWLDPSFRTWNLESYLPQICCPVLMIQGEQDEYGTVRQLDAIRARVAQSEVLMLPDCGHSPDRDAPEIVLARMKEFIAGLQRISDAG